jgi:hypothetical protein
MYNNERHTHILISFDAVSLFTKVPLKETSLLLEQQSEGGILDLFKQMLTSIYFLFNGEYYGQKMT